ncbi:hypothetical protein KEM48_012819 [Puccinia striiformis f. sp. tritici PST-130]|nr:hypothetical protein KEM48_012819 [Puccinia striiformis f. sp. tritici PST-130]
MVECHLPRLEAALPRFRNKFLFSHSAIHNAETGVKKLGLTPGDQAAKSSKRSVPFSKPGSRKRQFISPSSSYLAHSSSKTQEEATSINDLLGAVGEKNRNLVEELDRAVRENQTLRAQVLSEKDKLDENFSDMKLQLRDRLELEKRQSEISSQEIGALRKEIRQSLEAFRSLHERSDIQEDEILEPNCLVHLSFQDARKAIGVAKEVDEDRKKSAQAQHMRQGLSTELILLLTPNTKRARANGH